MTQTELNKVLELHKLWLADDGGIRANLSGADLSDASLSGANLSGANLSGANLSGADLRRADLSGASLSGANLSGADLSDASLRRADLSGANLSGANLSGADLRCADLSDASLSGANLSDASLSGAQNLLSAVNYLDAHFEKTADGFVAYKTFGGMYTPPDGWVLEAGAIIEETVNPNRTDECGCGINVAPLEWVKANYTGEIWKVLIEWPWLAGVVVPFGTDGKIRCERVRLLEKINR